MRLPCPHCGERELREFSYLGDASVRRPDPAQPQAAADFHRYVYLRDNPAGQMQEYWYHAAGCHAWLVVTRNTLTHVVEGVVTAESHSRSAADQTGPQA